MVPTILIIDDDQALLRLMEKELGEYADFFSVVTAGDGQAALNVLSDSDISIVLSDLRMPGIDGFEMLSFILKLYPDIPVMAMTAYDRPKTRDVVMKSGAAEYLTKPVDGIVLFRHIMKLLKKKEEGGSLNRVSLDTYLQLVEMEEQTCTLRIRSKKGIRSGVLFFRKGQLMDARIGNRKGLEAAYEILSWSGVSLSIENSCPISEKLIEGELQAILLDAMRSKDENGDVDSAAGIQNGKEPPGKVEAVSRPGAGSPSAAVENKPAVNAKAMPSGAQSPKIKAPEEKLSPVKAAEKKLVAAMGGENGILDVYSDPESAALIARVESLGQLFESGVLNVIYINKVDRQVLVVPDEENVVVMLEKGLPREGLIAALS